MPDEQPVIRTVLSVMFRAKPLLRIGFAIMGDCRIDRERPVAAGQECVLLFDLHENT
jgi:hypothetical protein